MVLKTIVRELKEITDVIGSKSKRRFERKPWSGRTKSYIVPDEELLPCVESMGLGQGQWADLPPELLLDIIQRVEESETTWPARAVVTFCASVCRSWRQITKEIVMTPEQCGKITFPISLKQPGPRESPLQCFIRRDRSTSTYYLYFGLVPSEAENDKLLLAARKIRKGARTHFVISLVSDDFSRTSNMYVGKLRSNLIGTKFAIFDCQPPCEAPMQMTGRTSRRIKTKQVYPRVPAGNYAVGSISYELNVLRTRGPRRMNCVIHSIPLSSIEDGGTAPTPTSFSQSFDERVSPLPCSKVKESVTDIRSVGSLGSPVGVQHSVEPLILKNKAPRWHEQLQCWCLNFKGRVTVASVKNFQLAAAVEPSHNVPAADQEKVILQFGKIGKDIFTMDYRYPLSAFQAFAICLSSFDTKPACE